MQNDDAVRFLKAYNAVTAGVTATLRMRPRPLRGKAVTEARAYLAWAKAEGVDPVLFMRARHDAAPGARVPISRLHHVSASFMANYRDWGEWKQSKVATEERFPAVDDTDNDGMSPLHEAARAQLSDHPVVCMYSAAITGGWHPDSQHCQACRKAKDCRAALPTLTRRRRDWGQRVRG